MPDALPKHDDAQDESRFIEQVMDRLNELQAQQERNDILRYWAGWLITEDIPSCELFAFDAISLIEEMAKLLRTKGASGTKLDLVGPIKIAVGNRYIGLPTVVYEFPESFWIERDNRRITVACVALRLTFERDSKSRCWHLKSCRSLRSTAAPRRSARYSGMRASRRLV